MSHFFFSFLSVWRGSHGKSGRAVCGGGGGDGGVCECVGSSEPAFQEREILDLKLEIWLGAPQGRKVGHMRDSFSLGCLLED